MSNLVNTKEKRKNLRYIKGADVPPPYYTDRGTREIVYYSTHALDIAERAMKAIRTDIRDNSALEAYYTGEYRPNCNCYQHKMVKALLQWEKIMSKEA